MESTFSRYVRLVIVAAAIVMCIGVMAWGVWRQVDIWEQKAFWAEHRAVTKVISRWQSTPPAEYDPHIWRNVVGTVQSAVHNVCYTRQHVPVVEMKRLREEIEAADRHPITLQTWDWLWARLARTGPKGNEYIQRMTPLWEEAREALQASAAPFQPPTADGQTP